MKINGVAIKTLSRSVDADGYIIYQGTIYIDGKKQGLWSQDYYGGSDNYDFNEDLLTERVNMFKPQIPDDFVYKKIFNNNIFLSILAKLNGDEKIYKKAVKEGYNTLFIMSDKVYSSYLKTYYLKTYEPTPVTDEEFYEKNSKCLEEFKAAMYKNAEISSRIYRSLKDFDITVDETHSLPDWILNI